MQDSVIGRQVEADWGAMIPPSVGVIAGTRVCPGVWERQVLINWDDDSSDWYNIKEIRMPGWRSVNGSPIGLYWKMSETWMESFGEVK